MELHPVEVTRELVRLLRVEADGRRDVANVMAVSFHASRSDVTLEYFSRRNVRKRRIASGW